MGQSEYTGQHHHILSGFQTSDVDHPWPVGRRPILASERLLQLLFGLVDPGYRYTRADQVEFVVGHAGIAISAHQIAADPGISGGVGSEALLQPSEDRAL